MDRQEFFRRLGYLLRAIPENERMDALAYYNDYFDEAGAGNEQRVIQELGSPEQVAQTILDDYEKNRKDTYTTYENYENSNVVWNNNETHRRGKPKKSKAERILWIILILLAFPIWITVLAVVFGIGLAVFGSLFGVTAGVGVSGIGMLAGGFVLLFAGIFRLFTSPIEGIVMIGVGAILSAISILFILFMVLLIVKWIPIFIRAVVTCIRGILVHQRGGDEI